MDKTKILIFIHGLGNGGAERSVVELIRYYNRGKYIIKVLTHEANKESDYAYCVKKDDYFEPAIKLKFLISARLRIKNEILGIKFKKLKYLFLKLYYSVFLYPKIKKSILNKTHKSNVISSQIYLQNLFITNAPKIARLQLAIEEFKPDILAGSMMESSNALIYLAKIDKAWPENSIKWVVIEQNNTLARLRDYYHGEIFYFWKHYSAIVFDSADFIIAVSAGIKNGLHKYFNTELSKIFIIHNQVNTYDVDKAVSQSGNVNAPYIISAGRYHTQKQFNVLIDAFSQIHQDIDHQLIILGKGEEELHLKNKISKLGLKHKVHLMPFNSTPWGLFKNADVFVLSSKYEGFPLVLLEAMRCKIPVVSFDCSYGPDEIIADGINGLLVPRNNIKLLAEKILLVLRDKDLAQKIANNAFNRASDFDSKSIALKYDDLFHRISN